MTINAETTKVNDWVSISSAIDLNAIIPNDVAAVGISVFLESDSGEAMPFPMRLYPVSGSKTITLSSAPNQLESWDTNTNRFKTSKYILQGNLYNIQPGTYQVTLGFKLTNIDPNTVITTESTDTNINSDDDTNVLSETSSEASTETNDETAAWALSTTYAVNDKVHFNGNSYTCYQAHTAHSSTWTPELTEGILWVLLGTYTAPSDDTVDDSGSDSSDNTGSDEDDSTTTDDTSSDSTTDDSTDTDNSSDDDSDSDDDSTDTDGASDDATDNSSSDDDSNSGDNPSYPVWTLNQAYTVGDKVFYNDTVYECFQTHVAWASDWTPDSTLGILWKIAEDQSGTPSDSDSSGYSDSNSDDSTDTDETSDDTGSSDDSNDDTTDNSSSDSSDNTDSNDDSTTDNDNSSDDDSNSDDTGNSDDSSDDATDNTSIDGLSVSGISNGGTYNNAVVINATASQGNLTAKIDGEPFTLNTSFSRTGVHKLTLTLTNGSSIQEENIYFRIGNIPNYTEPEKRVIAYFIAWGVYARNYHVSTLRPYADTITHINYAFANIQNGKVVLGDPYADIDKYYAGDSWDTGSMRGNFNQLIKLKKDYPHIKTLISVGGWTWSKNFSDIALTESSRKTFATSAVNFMLKYGFDGIDIDWEYPVSGGLGTNTYRASDKENYTLLMKEIRQQLDEIESAFSDNQHFLTTIAAPAGSDKYQNIELNDITEHLDWVNIMAYDFHGTWDSFTNHNAALYANDEDPSSGVVKTDYNVASAIQGFIESGVPANKIVPGLAFYGRSYGNTSSSNNGLYQSFSGAGQGSWEAGVYDYEDLKALESNTSFQYHWDDQAKVPYLYNPSTGEWISYDNADSIREKVNYFELHNLGGAMVWELTGDDDTHSLLQLIDTEFNN